MGDTCRRCSQGRSRRRRPHCATWWPRSSGSGRSPVVRARPSRTVRRFRPTPSCLRRASRRRPCHRTSRRSRTTTGSSWIRGCPERSTASWMARRSRSSAPASPRSTSRARSSTDTRTPVSSRCRATATCRCRTRTRGAPDSRSPRSRSPSFSRSMTPWPRRRRACGRQAPTGRVPSTRCARSRRRCGWRWATTCGARSSTTTAMTGRSTATAWRRRSRATSTIGRRRAGSTFTLPPSRRSSPRGSGSGSGRSPPTRTSPRRGRST